MKVYTSKEELKNEIRKTYFRTKIRKWKKLML